MLDKFDLANFLYGNGLISPIYFNKFINIHITNLKVHMTVIIDLLEF